MDKLSGNSEPSVRKLSKDNWPSLETKLQGHLGRDGSGVNVQGDEAASGAELKCEQNYEKNQPFVEMIQGGQGGQDRIDSYEYVVTESEM